MQWKTFGTLTLILGGTTYLSSQTIPDSGLALAFKEVAVLPDSTPGDPPRISVVTEDPYGRLFANDQRGPLYLIDVNTGNVEEYLDLRDYPDLAILSTSEAGFQSFAFHPDFKEAGKPGFGRIYTMHSSSQTSTAPDFDPGGQTALYSLLVEWRTATPEASSFLPENANQPYRVIMTLKQPFGNHNAGLIAFNPLGRSGSNDFGNLYIAIGDGGSGGDPQENAEDPSNPFGAILRINPLGSNSANGQYGLVADNALASDDQPETLAEIYAYGLRNPQRFGWDIVSGEMYIADIGQNQAEEISRAVNGGHFGWDIREGSFRYEGANNSSLIDPIAEYRHSASFPNTPTSISNRAVTLGEVVRGSRIPQLEGFLILSDFPTGTLMRLNVDEEDSAGLEIIRLARPDGNPVHFLDLINETRSKRGLSQTNRADVRFGVNTPGRVFISNKKDGVLRQLLPVNPFSLHVEYREEGIRISFDGLLEESENLDNWETVFPQPKSPTDLPSSENSQFFRAK